MLNGDALGDAIMAAVDALSDTQKREDRQAIFRAMGGAIVTYVTVNAVVAVTGVTPGSGTAGGTIT